MNHSITFHRDAPLKSACGGRLANVKAGQKGWIADIDVAFTHYEVQLEGQNGRYTTPVGYATVQGVKFTTENAADCRAKLLYDHHRDGVLYKAGHDFGIVLEVNSQDTHLKLAMVSRDKAGDVIKTIQADFASVEIVPGRFSHHSNTHHRRCTFITSHTVSKQDGGPVTIKKDSVALIVRVDDKLKTAWIKQTTGPHVVYKVPSDIVKIEKQHKPEDIRDCTFRLRRDVRIKTPGDEYLTLKAGDNPDSGIIKSALTDGDGRCILRVAATVKSQHGVTLPISFTDIEVGRPVAKYETVFSAPPLSTPTDPAKVGGLKKKIKDVKPLMRAFAAACDEHKKKLPDLRDEIKSKINSKGRRDELAQAFSDGIAASSPQLLKLLTGPDFTIEDVLAVAKDAGDGNTRAGVYLRVYWGFSKDSPYHGRVFVYVVKARHFSQRNATHGTFTKSEARRKGKNPHYRIAHAAQNKKVVELFAHARESGGTLKQGDLIRDVTEQMFLLIFDAYSEYVLKDSDEPEDTVDAVSKVSATADAAVTAKTLIELAKGVAKATGFKIGSVRSKHGEVHGLCLQSPMYASDTIADSTRWVRLELPDRYSFKRRSYTAQPPDKEARKATKSNKPDKAAKTDDDGEDDGLNNLMVTIIWGTLFGKKVSIKILVPEDAANGLVNGTTVYITFEVMKAGQHPVPYFQLPDVGPFNYWYPSCNEKEPHVNWGNSIGLSVKWQNAKGEWLEKYEQLVHPGHEYRQYYFKTAHGGSLTRFVNAVALYAYLMRGRFTDLPDFVPDLTVAQVIIPVIDHFKQRIELKLDDSPVRPLKPILFNMQAAANYMQKVLKLENVGGTFNKFNNLEGRISADRLLKAGNPRKPANSVQSIKGRKICDSCFFARAVSISTDTSVHQRILITSQVFRSMPQSATALYHCNKVEGSESCGACVQWGRPCSWSYITDVLGDDWLAHWPFAKYADNMPHVPTTLRGKEIAKALFRQQYNKELCKTRPTTAGVLVDITDVEAREVDGDDVHED